MNQNLGETISTNIDLPDFNDTEIAFKGKTKEDLNRAYWLFKIISSNFLTKVGPYLTNSAIKFGLPVIPLIKKTIFAQFCGGETIEECNATIAQLDSGKVGTILDYSVEGEQQEKSFIHTTEEIMAIIRKAKTDPRIPLTVFKPTGVARFELLKKVSAKASLSTAEQAEYFKVKARINQICRLAYELDVPVMIDAEESWIQNAIDDIATEMMRTYNRERAIVYNTYQLYRNDKLASLQADIYLAETDGFILGAKLVRGAYMEKERERAQRMGYPSPIHASKEATDTDYNEAIKRCMKHIEHTAFVAGTHNEQSCRLLAELINEYRLPHNHPHICFSQLLGMSDNLSFNLGSAGYNVTKYVPYGPVKSVLPYLFRRAEENTAIAGQTGRELKLIAAEKERRRTN
ncbi:L-proline dehydrogenase [Arcticibacter tournemirensis]|uniref:Proline dehydrogenase n=1 Tax=Arcticibacter tournemirensis TaxID=699437 RepID=A0A5M9GNF2_9SPHI|nr:proline dehydrogenase family protein [Arcticibacter tournemirensis]KAA8476263.1 proline dehydrogenase [Arcticibacter tournemirensis]TQM49527.1 L-proline dehydrogenase [Arcticibacter tournemirensis]